MRLLRTPRTWGGGECAGIQATHGEFGLCLVGATKGSTSTSVLAPSRIYKLCSPVRFSTIPCLGTFGTSSVLRNQDQRPLASMRNHDSDGWLSVLVFLVLSVLFPGLACHATPSPSPWDEMLIKHKWDAIPNDWVSLGQPPNGTTIKLQIALKANHENALIDALHEVSHPRGPKHVASLVLLSSRLTHVFVSDMGCTYQRSKLMSLSLHTQTPLSLYVRGLNTTACHHPPFQ